MPELPAAAVAVVAAAGLIAAGSSAVLLLAAAGTEFAVAAAAVAGTDFAVVAAAVGTGVAVVGSVAGIPHLVDAADIAIDLAEGTLMVEWRNYCLMWFVDSHKPAAVEPAALVVGAAAAAAVVVVAAAAKASASSFALYSLYPSFEPQEQHSR